jgi:hypothetical protein
MDETQTKDNQENYRAEYDVVSEGYRFFVSIRFITAAFAMTIQSTLLTLYNQTAKDNQPAGFAVFVMAIFFMAAILVVEWRTIFLFRRIIKRGTEIEFYLGLQNGFFHGIAELSAEKGFRSFITHTWGINFVYFGISILWIVLLFTALVV